MLENQMAINPYPDDLPPLRSHVEVHPLQRFVQTNEPGSGVSPVLFAYLHGYADTGIRAGLESDNNVAMMARGAYWALDPEHTASRALLEFVEEAFSE